MTASQTGQAGHAIEIQSEKENNYCDAITMLQECNNGLCLLDQAQVHAVVEKFSLKDGGDRELHCLCDTLTLPLQPLKVMEYELGSFVTSLIEMKLDQTMMFKC